MKNIKFVDTWRWNTAYSQFGKDPQVWRAPPSWLPWKVYLLCRREKEGLWGQELSPHDPPKFLGRPLNFIFQPLPTSSLSSVLSSISYCLYYPFSLLAYPRSRCLRKCPSPFLPQPPSSYIERTHGEGRKK